MWSPGAKRPLMSCWRSSSSTASDSVGGRTRVSVELVVVTEKSFMIWGSLVTYGSKGTESNGFADRGDRVARGRRARCVLLAGGARGKPRMDRGRGRRGPRHRGDGRRRGGADPPCDRERASD